MAPSRGRLVLVPGFTQTAASWDAVVEEVGDDCEVVVLEVPERASFVETAAALGEAGGRATYAGYSMGGRLVLQLALLRPHLVSALALVSATAGIENPAERAARVVADEELAASIERDGVEAFLASWLSRPLFAGVPPDAPGLAERASQPASRLASQLRVLGTGAMEPLWDHLGDLPMPVAVITGAADEKFDALGDRMFARLRNAVRLILPAGHALPLEQPRRLGRFLAAFARDPRSVG